MRVCTWLYVTVRLYRTPVTTSTGDPRRPSVCLFKSTRGGINNIRRRQGCETRYVRNECFRSARPVQVRPSGDRKTLRRQVLGGVSWSRFLLINNLRREGRKLFQGGISCDILLYPRGCRGYRSLNHSPPHLSFLTLTRFSLHQIVDCLPSLSPRHSSHPRPTTPFYLRPLSHQTSKSILFKFQGIDIVVGADMGSQSWPLEFADYVLSQQVAIMSKYGNQISYGCRHFLERLKVLDSG